MAEREGFEPSVPRLAVHAISSRAPSASSDISPIYYQQIFGPLPNVRCYGVSRFEKLLKNPPQNSIERLYCLREKSQGGIIILEHYDLENEPCKMPPSFIKLALLLKIPFYARVERVHSGFPG